MKEFKHLGRKIGVVSNALQKGGKAAIVIGSATGQPELVGLGGVAVTAGKVGSILKAK